MLTTVVAVNDYDVNRLMFVCVWMCTFTFSKEQQQQQQQQHQHQLCEVLNSCYIYNNLITNLRVFFAWRFSITTFSFCFFFHLCRQDKTEMIVSTKIHMQSQWFFTFTHTHAYDSFFSISSFRQIQANLWPFIVAVSFRNNNNKKKKKINGLLNLLM